MLKNMLKNMLEFYTIDLDDINDKARYMITFYYGDSLHPYNEEYTFSNCIPLAATRLDEMSSFINKNGDRIYCSLNKSYNKYKVGFCTYYLRTSVLTNIEHTGNYLKIANKYYIDLEGSTLYV